jgi:D-beta-D-heptose 7-phosphate kinase/D-beta-D-heptose 1-phosphate adenosyltransferase
MRPCRHERSRPRYAPGSRLVKPLLVIGDALLDRDLQGRVQRCCPDAPAPVLDEQRTLSRPGGAALAAVLAAGGGREVTLITALGDDLPGGELASLLASHGVELLDLRSAAATPEKVRVRNGSRTLLRIDRGERRARIGPLTAAARATIGWAETILVSDYGRGLTAHAGVRGSLSAAALVKTIVWDPHPRGGGPVGGVTLATPNRAEARGFIAAISNSRQDISDPAGDGAPPQAWGRRLAAMWRARHVCVTCGAEGAALCAERSSRLIAPPGVFDGDVCGSGDQFAATLSGALADGASPLEAARDGVTRASEFVAAGGASGWASRAAAESCAWRPPATASRGHALEAGALATAVHAERGRLVATGGCFDLLHAGHISTLQAARDLGDCLIVCLNSDASVSRLKGAGRPLVRARDRARVLEALACVDAVTIFDEDTPARVLGELRPDVWVKGGDYGERELPERAAVERWGGRVLTLPYLDGHSTSGLLEEVACRGGS